MKPKTHTFTVGGRELSFSHEDDAAATAFIAQVKQAFADQAKELKTAKADLEVAKEKVTEFDALSAQVKAIKDDLVKDIVKYRRLADDTIQEADETAALEGNTIDRLQTLLKREEKSFASRGGKRQLGGGDSAPDKLGDEIPEEEDFFA